MIGLLASPLARYAAIACAFALVAGWAWAERAGRSIAVLELRAAQREVAALETRIKQMETRRVEEDRVRREPDPVGRLRDEWGRPD